jgi:hypothetical protein
MLHAKVHLRNKLPMAGVAKKVFNASHCVGGGIDSVIQLWCNRLKLSQGSGQLIDHDNAPASCGGKIHSSRMSRPPDRTSERRAQGISG